MLNRNLFLQQQPMLGEGAGRGENWKEFDILSGESAGQPGLASHWLEGWHCLEVGILYETIKVTMETELPLQELSNH